MPARVGELMVIIRAQDFASRTLRRAGAEFGALSRSQMAFQKSQARMFDLTTQKRYIDQVQRHIAVEKQLADVQRKRMFLQKRGRGLLGASRTLTGGTSLTGQAGRQAGFRSAAQAAFKESQKLASVEKALQAELKALGLSLDAMPAKFSRLALSELRAAQAAGATQAEMAALRAEMAMQARMMPIERMERFGHAMSAVGRTAQLWGAGLTLAMGLAARSAANFNKELSAAATQARDLNAPVSQVQTRIDQMGNGFDQAGRHVKGILELMQEFPASADDMARSSYDIFSSMDLEEKGVINVAKGMGLLNKANQLAVAENGSLEDATNAMITVLNNFDPKLQHVQGTMNTMADIIRFGRMRLEDFNVMLNKIAPAAADAGLNLQDVGGAMAFLTTQMPSQRMVSTGIARLLEFLRKPDVRAGFKKFGVDIQKANGHLRSLPNIMKDIAKAFPMLTTGQKGAAEFFQEISAVGRGEGRGVVGTAEGRRAFSEVMTHMDQYLDAQNRIKKNTDELRKSQEAQLHSFGVQWEIFVNRLHALFIEIGNAAAPAFGQIGGYLNTVVKFLRDMSPATKEAIARVAVFAGVGLLLGGVLLSIVGSIAALVATLRVLGIRFGETTGRLAKFAAIARFLAGLNIIRLLIKVSFGGDPSAIDLLTGALSGAMLGSRFGPIGAAIGAITVPIVLKIIADETSPRDAAKKAYKEYQYEFIRQRKAHMSDWEKVNPLTLFRGHSDRPKTFKEWLPLFKAQQKLNRELKTYDEGSLAGSKYTRAHSKAMTEAEQKTKVFKDRLHEWYVAQLAATNAAKKYKEQMKQWSAQLVQATKDATTSVMDDLRNMFMKFKEANEQMFGELGGGPLLSSPTGQLLAEWGLTPSLSFLTEDLKEQADQFERVGRAMNRLKRLKVPQGAKDAIRGFIQGLSPGVQRDTFIRELMTAKPGQIQALVAQWKRKNKDIQAQTKMDFSDEIASFKKAGLKMGDAIKMGFEDARVAAFFDTWVKSKFPNVINQAVNDVVNKWKIEHPPPKAPPGGPGARPTAPGKNGSSDSHDINTEINIIVGESKGAGYPGNTAADKRLAFAIAQALVTYGSSYKTPKGTIGHQ